MPIAITQAVQVSMATFAVVNKFPFSTQAAIDAAAALLGLGFKLIGNNNWAPTSKLPEIGDIWDNLYPASFTTPVADPVDPDPTKPTTLTEAAAIVAMKLDAQDAANEAATNAAAELRAAQADLEALIPIPGA